MAEEAASVEELRKLLEQIDSQLGSEEAKRDKELKSRLEARKIRLQAEIEAAEEQRKKGDGGS